MNVKQTWPKVLVFVLSGLSILGTFLSMLFIEDADIVTALLTALGSIIGVAIYYIPTFLYSSPKIFLINWLGGWCCGIGWVVALIFAIKDRAIPTTPVGVPTDYSQNQVNNYWNNTDNQNQWGNQNQVPQQNQWDSNVNQNGQQTQWGNSGTQNVQNNQWETPQQPPQSNGNDYWNSGNDNNQNQNWN